MPAISKKIPYRLMRKLHAMGRPLGGKKEIAQVTGLSPAAITEVLRKERALPATIEKLEKVLQS